MAPRPARTDVPSAARAPVLCQARSHQLRVSPLGGQLNVRSVLNDEMSTTISGT